MHMVLTYVKTPKQTSKTSQLTNGLDAMALDYSDYTMEELIAANPSYSRPRIGYIGWDSAIAPPDKTTTFLFILKGNIAAFTMNGYFYTVHEPSTEWELRYKPVNQGSYADSK